MHAALSIISLTQARWLADAIWVAKNGCYKCVTLNLSQGVRTFLTLNPDSYRGCKAMIGRFLFRAKECYPDSHRDRFGLPMARRASFTMEAMGFTHGYSYYAPPELMPK
jgi:hypothetical protein